MDNSFSSEVFHGHMGALDREKLFILRFYFIYHLNHLIVKSQIPASHVEQLSSMVEKSKDFVMDVLEELKKRFKYSMSKKYIFDGSQYKILHGSEDDDVVSTSHRTRAFTERLHRLEQQKREWAGWVGSFMSRDGVPLSKESYKYGALPSSFVPSNSSISSYLDEPQQQYVPTFSQSGIMGLSMGGLFSGNPSSSYQDELPSFPPSIQCDMSFPSINGPSYLHHDDIPHVEMEATSPKSHLPHIREQVELEQESIVGRRRTSDKDLYGPGSSPMNSGAVSSCDEPPRDLLHSTQGLFADFSISGEEAQPRRSVFQPFVDHDHTNPSHDISSHFDSRPPSFKKFSPIRDISEVDSVIHFPSSSSIDEKKQEIHDILKPALSRFSSKHVHTPIPLSPISGALPPLCTPTSGSISSLNDSQSPILSFLGQCQGPGGVTSVGQRASHPFHGYGFFGEVK
ncbi:hypothetical protein ADUPG1_011630 [Aduncisulcus paluster]|uniref:Uncharacterized protein n=1 Tax=Aduncisulcus paluster TaxID=2918883 RepID=A0ABQ5JXA8_9EUKA|nr:hypothetical protein ADUPG1_011630 [Aduncisulcus paluster]